MRMQRRCGEVDERATPGSAKADAGGSTQRNRNRDVGVGYVGGCDQGEWATAG
jgi:hypothetical protein